MFGKPVEMQGRKVKGSNPYEVWYDSRLPFKFSLDVYVTLTVVNVAAIVFDICCSFWNCGVFLFPGNQAGRRNCETEHPMPQGKPVETQGRKVKGPKPQDAVW
jgi:hypothetical protein